MKVNVVEACSKMMDPEVPQALRLQAILVSAPPPAAAQLRCWG